LLQHFPVDAVWVQEIDYSSYVYAQVLHTIDSLDVPVQSVQAGLLDSTLAPLYIRAVGPRRFDLRDPPKNANNISIDLQCFYGATTLLLTGDAEQEMEGDQLLYGDLLHSQLLKVPHHGSATSSTPAYLDFVRPRRAAISVGTGNKYGHPAESTLANYRLRKIEVQRTDREGALLYESNGKKWTRSIWRN
jgi:beta-lactamase superfamily II metal-dependent hydrolase